MMPYPQKAQTYLSNGDAPESSSIHKIAVEDSPLLVILRHARAIDEDVDAETRLTCPPRRRDRRQGATEQQWNMPVWLDPKDDRYARVSRGHCNASLSSVDWLPTRRKLGERVELSRVIVV